MVRTRNAGRRLDRDRLLARARVFRHPPDKDNAEIATAKTANAIRNRDEALRQSAEWGGGQGRGTRARWEPGATHEVGDRIQADGRPGIEYRCVGIFGDAKSGGAPIPADTKVGAHVRDQDVEWLCVLGWKGRVGYGSLGMRDLSRAMQGAALVQAHVPGQENAERRRRNRKKAIRQAIRLAADKSRIRHGASRTGPDTDWRSKKAAAMAEKERNL